MKQAQAMQENFEKAQDELALVEVSGEAGSGLVKVVMTCKHEVKRVTIDQACGLTIWPAAGGLGRRFNAALRQTGGDLCQAGKLTAGLPPGMKLPF